MMRILGKFITCGMCVVGPLWCTALTLRLSTLLGKLQTGERKIGNKRYKCTMGFLLPLTSCRRTHIHAGARTLGTLFGACATNVPSVRVVVSPPRDSTTTDSNIGTYGVYVPYILPNVVIFLMC